MSDETGPSPLRRVLAPFKEFLQAEAASGFVLLGVTLITLAWANSPAGDSYATFINHKLTIGWGSWSITESLQHWVNDLLMALFFFVVGLEIKRELVTGELRAPRAAALPAIAAAGGVILPAVLFTVLAPAGEASRGWGVPMATDIAFAVGVLALLGARASDGAKLLLVSLAIVDDILAIAVIAVFYNEHLAWVWLAVAVLLVLVILALHRVFVSPWAYLLPAAVLWLAVFESGVHATIAGVALGLLTPARPIRGRPVLDRLEHSLHPYSVFLVVPLFALVNAGVDVRGGALAQALTAAVTWAVVVGLVVGKALGISGAVFAARRLRIGALPTGMPPLQVWPVAALGGIGFTVALFIADLAFTDPVLVRNAKVGILLGSAIAGVLGAIALRVVSPAQPGAAQD